MTATAFAAPDLHVIDNQPRARGNTFARTTTLKRTVWGRGTREDEAITSEVSHTKGIAHGVGAYRVKIAGDMKGRTTANLSTAKLALKQVFRTSADAHTYYMKMTVPWLNKGTRLCKIEAYMPIFTAMQKYSAAFYAAVDAFVPLYPKLLLEIEQEQGPAFRRDEYPQANEIGNYFSMRFASMMLPDVEADNDFRSVFGDAEVDRLLDENKKIYDAAFNNAMREVYERVFKAVSRMAEDLRLYDPADAKAHHFHDTLVSNIVELVELLPLLNVTDDPDLAAIAKDMKRRLTRYPPAMLRASETKREEVMLAAQEIARTASDRAEADADKAVGAISDFFA